MTIDVTKQRAELVKEALSWVGTPYHHMGRIKGVGADCLTFIAQVFEDSGLVEKVEIPYYPPDWLLHRSAERALEKLLEYCVEVPPPPERAPLPGDIVLWRFGRCYSHGALVVAWPTVVHAFIRKKIGRTDADADPVLSKIGENVADKGKPRPRRFFTLKSWS